MIEPRDEDFYYEGGELTEEQVREQLEAWKDQYQSIYMVEINDIPFIFRELSRAEYKKSLDYYEDVYERAEYVCRLCILDPLEIDYTEEIYAGIPEILCQQILEESGFLGDAGKIEGLIAKYDAEMNEFANQVSCIIVAAFPNLDIEEVEKWSMEKTMWYFSRARWLLRETRGIEFTKEEAPQ